MLWRFILSINKFSKYGIVLVAAITLATAVQTQFGQSSTKVYAEETATSDEANVIHPRMFYIAGKLSDEPSIGWLSGRVVGPKGYEIEEGPDIDGYPYYTITGPEGKRYSVGDVITMEEPGLFGHSNYEDDAILYTYYRTNPNSVSEAPAVSTTPATSEAPAVSTTPTTSEAPAVSTTPATSEAPAVSTTPATSEAPAVSTTPATSEAPAVSTTPATSEAPAVSTMPATSLVPTKDNHSMNFVTPSYTQTRSAGIKSETDGKLTSQGLPKTGDTNSKVGMLGMIFVGLGLTSFVYKGRHRRS